MVVRQGEILDAERVRGQPFLPGGAWFYVACLGAGTPKASVYLEWLNDLKAKGAYGGSPKAVLDSLPANGERPFLATLPQAALANPNGPLAVFGHVDLTWTYGFSGTANPSESRKGRFLEPLKLLVRGRRAGTALDKLMVSYRETNHALLESYQAEKQASAPGGFDPKERARLWMLRNDLRGYVLLGDPAARLPLRKNATRAEVGDRAPIPPARAIAPVVVEVLRGDEAPRAIAARAGVPLETLWDWVDAYRADLRQRRGP
jgi:hypothetical protein